MRQRGSQRGMVGIGAMVVVGALALATAGLSAGAAGAADPGVTDKTVKLGYIFSQTGVAGSTFKNSGKAFQARIDAQNAKGGVNGRKLETVVIDDQSSGANLTATQDLVQNSNVFAVINNSSFAFLSYRFLLQNKVPMIGGGFDGTYYGQPGSENIISELGNAAPVNGVTSDNIPQVMKKLGAKKVAALAYGASASSSAAGANLQKFAVPAAGLKAVYTNTSVDFGTSDVGPLVLGIKNSGADAVYLPMVASTNFAVVQGLTQNGVTMKANVLATGYGQDLLDSPIASTLGPNTLLATNFAPVELNTKATKQFRSDLKKYANYTGVPDYGMYTGYLAADLAITGLEQAGKTPTRQGFVDGLHQLGTWDGGGLTCQPVDISLTNFGKPPATQCSYYVQVKNGKFVLYPSNGKSVVGKTIGASAVAEPTTTAPPAGG